MTNYTDIIEELTKITTPNAKYFKTVHCNNLSKMVDIIDFLKTVEIKIIDDKEKLKKQFSKFENDDKKKQASGNENKD